MLRARAPGDQVRLERLVGNALPGTGAVAVSGSMVLRRSSVVPPFVVHVKPVGGPQPDHGARHVAVLVLIVEPGRRHRINPELVATTLELTPAETQVAVWLAEGNSVRRHGRCDGAYESRHLLAPAADLPEALHLAAGGPGAVGAVARRSGVRAALPAFPGGRAIWTAARATASAVIRPARSMKTVAVSLTLTSGTDSSSRPSRRPNSW